MIQEQKHIINKVFLEVNTNSNTVAYSLKDNLSMFLNENILPYLENYLNNIEHQLSSEIVQIPKLTLNLKAPYQNDFRDLKAEIKTKLVEKLDCIIKTPNQSKQELVHLSSQEQKARSFLFFIESGTNPWWSTNNNSKPFTQKEILEITTSKFFKKKLLTLIQNPIARNRLIKQFTDQDLKVILKSTFNNNKETTILNQKVVALISKLNNTSRDFIWSEISLYLHTKNTKHFIYSVTSVITFNPKNNASLQNYANTVLTILKQLLKISESEVVSILKTRNSNKEVPKIVDLIDSYNKIGLKEKVFSTLKPDIEVLKKSDQSFKGLIKENSNNTTTNFINKETIDLDTYIKESSLQKENYFTENKDSYYVMNAGLIILHPYLKQFFINCNLLNKNDEIVNKELAVHTLHYLATKKEQQLESQMLFEKFLCGIPIHTPIRRTVELSKTIKEQAEELLTSIIENWEVLNNASIHLLRNEFLQRDGKISFKEMNPKVIVERKTQDILVDRLPWSVGICKLPWLNYIIFTDW